MFKIFDRVLISFIHQDSCGYNIYLLCKLSGSQRLSLSVIPQIVTGQITCGLFLKRYRNLEQKPSLVKLTQRCVIENTIANTMCYLQFHFVCDKLFMSFRLILNALLLLFKCSWQTALFILKQKEFFVSLIA